MTITTELVLSLWAMLAIAWILGTFAAFTFMLRWWPPPKRRIRPVADTLFCLASLALSTVFLTGVMTGEIERIFHLFCHR